MFRPADAVETAECWQAAIETATGPSVLALTRQGLSCLRTTHVDENLCAKGAYVLAEADGARAATIIASGSEVSIAIEARLVCRTIPPRSVADRSAVSSS